MQIVMTSEELSDMFGLLGADAHARLCKMYHTAQTEGNIERDIKRELGAVIRSTIEDVTSMHPKHIIIDFS